MPNESVNTNLSSTDQSDNSRPQLNFDTSEADAILGGADPNAAQPVVEQTPAEQQQTETQQFTPEQINLIRQQLQVNQQQQTQPPVEQQTQQTTDGPVYSEHFVAANTKFKEQTGLDFGAAIDEYMQATVGMPLKQTIETVQGMSAYINQRQQTDVIEQATNELKTEWGQSYQSYMEIARAEYDKLPQQTAQQLQFKQSLNNSQGAKLLLAQALQSQGSTGTATARVPVQYNPFSSPSPSNSVTNGQVPQLLYSQILAMSDAQYNSKVVQDAIALGPGRGFIQDVMTQQPTPNVQGVVNGHIAQPSQMMLGY